MKLNKRGDFGMGMFIGLLALYVTFQMTFINVDTPSSLTYGAGTYCDEGYKTLSARNMVLFGETHWTELDEYAGWVKGSPVTVYFNYVMFEIFGVSLATARAGNVLFAVGCLIVFYLILKKIYDRKHALLGVVLLGVNQVFFFYSRIALFEFKMMFFVLLGLYVMLFVREHQFFIIPMIGSWIAAYYSKASVEMFYITLVVYFSLMYKNGAGLNLMLKKRNLWILAFLLIIGLGVLQFFFVFQREAYDSVSLFGRGYRSPAGAAVFWVGQEFFTKNAVLIFLGVIYAGYVIVQLMEQKGYNKYDVLFLVWFVLGTGMFALVSFVQLGYYIYVIFPLIALAVRGILLFGPIMKTLFEEGYAGLKFVVVLLAVYLLIVHTSFLSFWPIRSEYGWEAQAVKYFGLMSTVIVCFVTVGFVVLRRNEKYVSGVFKLSKRKYVSVFVTLILLSNLVPIASWAVRPKYELKEISQKLDGFKDGSIFIGDWAPQLVIDTPHRVLYTMTSKDLKASRNFHNLGEIKPDYLVIVDRLNDHMLEHFRMEYPGVSATSPHSSYTYAGKKILLYELDFNALEANYIVEKMGRSKQ